MTTPGKGEIGRPYKADDMSDRESQVHRHGKANQIRRKPNFDQIDLILGKIHLEGFEPRRPPNRRSYTSAKDARFEDVKRR